MLKNKLQLQKNNNNTITNTIGREILMYVFYFSVKSFSVPIHVLDTFYNTSFSMPVFPFSILALFWMPMFSFSIS